MTKARLGLKYNVSYQAKDAEGNTKRLFEYNKKGWDYFKKYGMPAAQTPEYGSYKDILEVSNLVVDAGKTAVASRLFDNSTYPPFSHIAIGDGVTAAAAGDTALENELTGNGSDRAAATTGLVTTDVLNDSAQFSVTFNFTGNVTVSESGLFNDATAGTMLARDLLGPASFVNGESLTVTWRLDVD